MSLAIIKTRKNAFIDVYTRYDATGSEQTYTVPSGVTQLRAYVYGVIWIQTIG